MAGSTGDNHHGSVSSGITKPMAGSTDGNRNGLGGQRPGSDNTRNGLTLRVGNAGTDSSSRGFLHGVALVEVAEAAVAQGAVVAAAEEAVLQAYFFRIRVWASLYGADLEAPRAAASGGGTSGLRLWLWACLAATAGAQIVGFPDQAHDMIHAWGLV